MTTLSPATPAEFAEAVRATPRVIVVGSGTKPRLSAVSSDWTRISTAKLRGIVEYEPSEFTFTALAGTPVREIAATLAAQGQYLPFDPLFVAAGATLGGTVAAGLSGPGRFRYGTLRDFILGVRFVDGTGRLMRLGGKVVKNAAGFDIPKFFVGGLGRFGAMAEITFKVFPRAPQLRTLRLDAADDAAKVRILNEAARTRWELDAMETCATAAEPGVLVRIGGPEAALDALIAEIFSRFPGRVVAEAEAQAMWSAIGELSWAHADGTLVKVALTPAQLPEFSNWVRAQKDARGWLGAGANVGYLSLPAGATLPALPWQALTLRGPATTKLWPGPAPRFDVMRATKTALDPQNRFPSLDEA